MSLIIGGEERQSGGQERRGKGREKGLPEACLDGMGRPICNQKWLIHGGLGARKSEEGRPKGRNEQPGPLMPS